MSDFPKRKGLGETELPPLREIQISEVRPRGESSYPPSGKFRIRITPPPPGSSIEMDLQNMLDFYPDGVAVFQVSRDKDMGRLLLANEPLEILTGFEPEEISQLALQDLLHPEENARNVDWLLRFPEMGTFRLPEVRLVRKDGSVVYCDIHGSIGRFQDRRLGFAFIQDVSERREAAEALRVSQARKEALIRSIPDMVSRVQDFQIVELHSPKGEAAVPPERLIGLNVRDMPIPKEVVKILLDGIQRALDTQEIQELEFSVPAPQGLLHREMRVVTSGPNEVITFTRNITQRKIQEAERGLLLKILESSPDYISVFTPEGNLLYSNPAFRSLRGILPDADPSELKVVDYHPPWAAELILREALPAAQRDGLWIGETAVLDSTSGEEIPVSQQILAERDPDGTVTHYSTIIRDIRGLKKAEQHRIVAERLDALQLVAGGLAHDANNVLSAMIGLAPLVKDPLEGFRALSQSLARSHDVDYEILLDARRGMLELYSRVMEAPQEFPVDSPVGLRQVASLAVDMFGQVLRDWQDMQQQMDRLQNLVANFRQLTADPLPVVVFDLHSLLKTLTLKKYLNKKPVSPVLLEVELERNPVLIWGHSELASVVENLIFNAKDALEGREGAKILVETSREDISDEKVQELIPRSPMSELPTGSFMRLRVQDNGTGMDEETRRHIFEPYYSTKRRSHEGSGHGGLGLAYILKLVKDTGGFITVESTLGERTTFDIYLPRAIRSQRLKQRSSGSWTAGKLR